MGSGPMVMAWGLIDPGDYYVFNSNHSGGIIQFGFGDGSVRAFRTQGSDNFSDFFSARWFMLMKTGGYGDGGYIDFNYLE
jgi:prepilin-type processing-associated H-X9-DG protein